MIHKKAKLSLKPQQHHQAQDKVAQLKTFFETDNNRLHPTCHKKIKKLLKLNNRKRLQSLKLILRKRINT
ncbi:hypothetical protein [Candidatus Odyssella acanthamoebae]|uniref:Uncharacterized protein n=1 Tax=Candidatus Odyssella acanthamoebae TaxID=91604 RepID=A0A077AX78_9PROT|nr:hypothetical protein [Candidatus Paracaedibacter acanthamoebae]AIK96584.1 hypothetical protein ID47_07385 [Candidatus Paracaedibacter acanthamoebae]